MNRRTTRRQPATFQTVTDATTTLGIVEGDANGHAVAVHVIRLELSLVGSNGRRSHEQVVLERGYGRALAALILNAEDQLDELVDPTKAAGSAPHKADPEPANEHDPQDRASRT